VNFRDVIASLPAQRLLPGHGVADLAFCFQFRFALSPKAHAFGSRSRVRHASRAALTVPNASLIR
jgi:hypothetical protein